MFVLGNDYSNFQNPNQNLNFLQVTLIYIFFAGKINRYSFYFRLPVGSRKNGIFRIASVLLTAAILDSGILLLVAHIIITTRNSFPSSCWQSWTPHTGSRMLTLGPLARNLMEGFLPKPNFHVC